MEDKSKPSNRKNQTSPTVKPNTQEVSAYKVLTLDLQKYLDQLKDWDLSEDQKVDIIHALWSMLRPFAELGFEIHPAQMAQNSRKYSTKKTPETKGKPAIQPGFVVSSQHHQKPDHEGDML